LQPTNAAWPSANRSSRFKSVTLALAGLLTTPEIQRLFAKRLLKPKVSATLVWLGAQWRRNHQAKAAKSHRKRYNVQL
jgi:hypothetical protein